MAFSGFWNKIFGKEDATSKTVAKERLRLVLVHDRLDVSEQTMNSLREDLIGVIGKYMEIDEPALEVSLTREDEGVALIANIPILRVRRDVQVEGLAAMESKMAATPETTAEATPVTKAENQAEVKATPAPTEEETKVRKSLRKDGPESVEAYIEA